MAADRKRVLTFIVQYPNFSETYMHEEMRNLEKNGYDVHVITYKKSPFPRNKPFDYTLIDYDLPCFVYYPFEQIDWSLCREESVRFLEEVGDIIEEFKPDILHGHYFGWACPLERLAETYKLPFTIRTHSMDVLSEPAHKLEKLCAYSNSPWCAGVLAFPPFRKTLLEHGMVESKIVDCLPLLNFEAFYHPEKKEKTGKIMCAGPASPKKDHNKFVDLAFKMKASPLEFNLYTDGYSAQSTIEYNESIGKPANITYVDPDDMSEVYLNHDWIVYTADPEINKVGFPVALLEAQATGLGVLWQELPGRREDQLDSLGGGGYLFSSIDEVPEVLARPYPEELRQKGFENASRFDAGKQSHILTDLWEAFDSKRRTFEDNSDALVSIVISYFEKEKTLRKTVDSALAQSYENIEVIIVDDASSRFPARSILGDELESKVKLITHDSNLGVSRARNTAIKASKGKFIVPLDADDLLDRDYVKRTLAAALADDLDCVYTQMQWFGDSDYLMTPKVSLVNLLSHKEGFSTFLYRREVFDSVGGYREDMPVGSDHQFLLSVTADDFKIARIEGTLWYYLKSEDGLAAVDLDKRLSNLMEINSSLYEKHWPGVLKELDGYYLSLYEEYHKTVREIQNYAEENNNLFQEYKRILYAHQRLVYENNKLNQINGMLRNMIDALREKIELLLPASYPVSLSDWIRTEFKELKRRLIKSRDREIELVAGSRIFDENYYLNSARKAGISVPDPVKHFVNEGWTIPINPSPLFDIEYYQEQLRSLNINWTGNPLIHYIESGAKLGVAISPIFDTGWYIKHYSDLKESNLNPLAHYITFGSKEGRFAVDPCVELVSNKVSFKRSDTESSSTVVESSDGPYDIIIGIHEASRTGAPLVGRAIARSLKSRGLNPLLIVCGAGSLMSELEREFSILDLSNQVDPPAYLEERLAQLENSGTLKCRRVIFSSSELHPLLGVLKENGYEVNLLIHEFLGFYQPPVRETLRRNTDMVVFPSQRVRDEAFELSEGPWNKSITIAQGLLDPEFGKRISQDTAREVVASATGASDGEFLIVSCGTADTRKGIDLFVQVAKNVLSRATKARFIWIGSPHHLGPEALNWAKQDVIQAGIEERVHFLKSMDDIEPFLKGSDLFLLPSRRDPFPCVVQQAMNSNLPVVAFRESGGVEEMLERGGGRLVPYLDIAAMADSVLEFIENQNVLDQEGERAVEIIKQDYDFEEYVDKLSDAMKISAGEKEKLLVTSR